MKKERGAITLFVLLAMMFFVMALISLFLVASSRARLEKQITGQIQESYQEDANTVYNSYFGGEIVPIYTAEQLLKIGSEEKIRINEENGKIYTFSKNATYVLKNNLEFSEEEMGLTESWYPVGNQIEDGLITGRFDGNHLEIKVTDLNGEIYVYNRENEYKKVIIPLPEGYVTSRIPGENTIEDGLVIYEMPEGGEVNWDNQTITIGGNTTNLQETTNQYVWIPVQDINDMVMCSSNTGDSVCNLILEEDTLKCTTHPDTATDLVGRLYISSSQSEGSGIYSYIMDFTKRDQTYNTSSYREPNTVSNDASNNLTINQLESDFTAMAKSVAKNGGFYISRYEVGANGDSKKGQQVLTASSSNGSNYLGADTWYGLYNTIRNISANKQMIWGCQYDQVIKFIGEESQIGHSNRNLTTDHALSGQNELDKMKNIYDLEGSYMEWTAESNSQRVFRGSVCNFASTGNFYSASCRYDGFTPNDVIYNRFSSRSTLYL